MVLDLPTYKSLRGITDADRDAALTIALEAADSRVRSATGIDFTDEGTSERVFEYNGSGFLTVPWYSTLISVSIDGSELGPDFYATGPGVDAHDTVLLFGRAPSPAMGFTRNLDTQCWWARRRRSRVAVTAEWGWPAGAPGDVKLAAAILVDEFAPAGADGDDANVVAKAIESYSVSYGPRSTAAAPLPPQVAQLLEPYTRPRF